MIILNYILTRNIHVFRERVSIHDFLRASSSNYWTVSLILSCKRPLLVSNNRTKDFKFPAFTPTFYTFRFVLACCSSRLSIISPGICVVLSFSIMTPYAMDMTTIGTK